MQQEQTLISIRVKHNTVPEKQQLHHFGMEIASKSLITLATFLFTYWC